MMKLSQLRPTSLREQALAELRAQLISGALKPGQVYSAAAIATELGVSNGPVREAMLSLVGDGLMEIVRNRGYRVTPISTHDREEIAEMRRLLEIPSMVRLTGSAKVAALEPVFRRLIDDLLRAAARGDLNAYLAADREFHLGLIRLLGNARLTETVGALRDTTRQYGLFEVITGGDVPDSAREHTDILDALLAGDASAVEALMHSHLRHLSHDGWSAPGLSPAAPGPAPEPAPIPAP